MNDLRREIAEHVQTAKTTSAQIHRFEQGLLRQENKAVRIAGTSVKFGEVGLLDVLDVQGTLRQAFQGYAHVQFDLAIALAELERLVGKELS